MTWVKIEHTPGPYLMRCHVCGWQFRVDMEPYSYESNPWVMCNPPRPSGHCRNVDCKMGPAAQELRRRIRESPCFSCKGEGLIIDADGVERYCPIEDCESSRLLQLEHEAFDRFIPQIFST